MTSATDNQTTELRPCKHCGEKPQVLKSDGRAAHACRVLDRELRMTVDEWNAVNEKGRTLTSSFMPKR